MANITNYLNKIKTAVYGKDVRGAIHDAIKQVYDDASVNHDNANMEVKMARGTHNTLNDRLDNVDEIQAQTNAQLSLKITTQQCKEEIAKAKLEGAGVDTSNFVMQSEIFEKSINLADISEENLIQNNYINYSNGELTSYENWSASDFIEVKENTEYSQIYYNDSQAKFLRQDQVYYAFYDGDKGYLTGGNTGDSTSPQKMESPADASYLRVSFASPRQNSSIMLIESVNEEIVINQDISHYIPFGKTLSVDIQKEINKSKEYIMSHVDALINTPKIIMPSKLYVVVDTEISIYNENVILCDDINRYDIDWYINQGNFYDQFDDCFRITPTSGREGIYNLKLTIRNKATFDIICSKTIQLHVVPKKKYTNKNVIFIGDSRTSAGYYSYEIQNVLSGGGITSIGTETTKVWIDNLQKDSTHEGRGGWSAKDYVTVSSKASYNNSFMNPLTNKFDFTYYMNNNDFSSVDCVFINLGTNGMLTKNLDNSIIDNINAMGEMIESIREYSATIPIFIELVTPPATQSGWTYVNRGGSVHEMMFNIFRNNELVIKFYDNQESQNIYLAPTIFNLDRKNDYGEKVVKLSKRNQKDITIQTNNVHPSSVGYYKMADVFWSLINAVV